MRFNTLDDWLQWQETLHPKEIDLGLERVLQVMERASLATRFDCPLITVAGTNGKGSVVAILESLALAAGLKVCSYTSPHLFRYNERLKLDGQSVSDAVLCESFQRIDQARLDTEFVHRSSPAPQTGELALTYFEFGTLAAIDIFSRADADLIILEVGLGGRLDAVNAMDADLSIITSVAIDHVDWLGDNREKIGAEKAGILRQNQPLIYGGRNAPQSVLERAKALHCPLQQMAEDFDVSDEGQGYWTLHSRFGDIRSIESPALIGAFQRENAATAILAMLTLREAGHLQLPAFEAQINNAMQNVVLTGRFQQLRTRPSVYVDVAHNPHAAAALASQLKQTCAEGGGAKTWAIVAMLADKDVNEVLDKVSREIDYWCFAGLDQVARGLSLEALLDRLSNGFLRVPVSGENLQKIRQEIAKNQCTILPDSQEEDTVFLADTVNHACESVLSRAGVLDRIIIFGSFYTVADAMTYFSDKSRDPMEH